MPYEKMLERVEAAYRICYASEPKGKPEEFIAAKIKDGHYSCLEHVSLSVEFVTNRAISHQLVRHRLAAYSQQSQRYCNYSKDKFGSEISFIDNSRIPTKMKPYNLKDIPQPPFFINLECYPRDISQNNTFYLSPYDINRLVNQTSEWAYMMLLYMKTVPEVARGVLTNDVSTKIYMTCNLREWRHIIDLRVLGTTGRPHYQIVELLKPCAIEFAEKYPVFFGDLHPENY